ENWLTNLLLARGLVKRQASVTFDVSRFDGGKCQAVLWRYKPQNEPCQVLAIHTFMLGVEVRPT
ncbi:MAG: hypothetical protein JXA21_13730, partial [Anaerolineae bacterium]|nr:hypothetical protein [Anaerolineae bacterium]